VIQLELHLEGRRRKRRPAFAAVSRAAARALAARRLEPLAEALPACQDPEEDVLFAARIHGVSALLASFEGGAALPEALRSGLSADRARGAARAQRLGEDLQRLGALAARAGLPFAPLKGSILAFQRYPDPAERPCADLDLLATDGSFDAWSRLLVEAGYSVQTESARDRVFLNPGARVPDSFAEHPDSPRQVELHRHLATKLLGRVVDVTPRYAARLRPGTLAGEPALLPDDGALALHLLVHAGPDLVGRGVRLLQLHDFTTISLPPALAGEATALLGEAAWGLGTLIQRALPTALPADLVAALPPPPPRRRRAWLSRPGLMTGEEERTLLVLAEAPLCASLPELWRRVADALPQRSYLDRAYGARNPLSRLARYYRDRFR